jgi:hypothetical protein
MPVLGKGHDLLFLVALQPVARRYLYPRRTASQCRDNHEHERKWCIQAIPAAFDLTSPFAIWDAILAAII